MTETNGNTDQVTDLLALEERARRNRDAAEELYQAVRAERRRTQGRAVTAAERARRIWGMTRIALLAAGIGAALKVAASWMHAKTTAALAVAAGGAVAGAALAPAVLLPGADEERVSGGHPTITRTVMGLPGRPESGPTVTITASPTTEPPASLSPTTESPAPSGTEPAETTPGTSPPPAADEPGTTPSPSGPSGTSPVETSPAEPPPVATAGCRVQVTLPPALRVRLLCF